jgi:NAD(P)-dependent dehydrogenase (short-subunit alcohol dehydrogenase family)
MAGRRVLVIGAGQETYGLPPEEVSLGNGRAACLRLAAEGAAIACADLNLDRAQETAAQIGDAGGVGTAFAVDATDEESMTALFDAAVADMGGVDGVLVNVGMGGPAWLSGTSAAAWDRTFALNARAHFLGCKLALQHLDDDGSVVLISSVASMKPGSRMPAYDSSKAALAGLCRHAAFEGRRRRVRVNVVVPGLIDTPMGRIATRNRPSRTAGQLPLGRQGTAWDIANGVLYLLSSEASYVTGQLLAIDGGLTTIQ